MYDIQFSATDDADWAEAVELIDDDTGLALADAATALFQLQVTDCGRALLNASTADSTMTKPSSNVIAWRFTQAQMGALCAGNTYRVGCRMTTDDGSEMLFSGTLAFIDGGLS